MLSYCFNGNPYTGNTLSLYLDGTLATTFFFRRVIHSRLVYTYFTIQTSDVKSANMYR